LTGSVYLGTWASKSVNAGSAHSQYMDILFRTGFLGFFLYMYLICKTFLFLRKEDKGLFLGIFGVLVYGLFHETFKESHGAFVLAFVVGMYVTHIRQLKNNC
jgi:O-antigen ligase